MALSGLDIYKLLPKTNCKECGFATCLAFAMQLAKKAVTIDKCPFISSESKKILEESGQPPIKLVSIGSGENKLDIGNETVLFRHEEKFHHPAGLGFIIEDSLKNEEILKKLKKVNSLTFERVGQVLCPNLVAIKQKGDAARFSDVVKLVSGNTKLALVLICNDLGSLKSALEVSSGNKPLVYYTGSTGLDEVCPLIKNSDASIVASAPDLERLSDLTKKISSYDIQQIVLDTGKKDINDKIWDLTQIRRLALKKSDRSLGYPVLCVVDEADPYEEIQQASTFIAKYAAIVLIKGIEQWQALAMLTLRQNIYTDPQKPLQIEPKVYPIGNVNNKSPVLLTTNFSLSYYTVLGEVEASKVPSYIVSIDTEGMSVLTAWAAEKFTPDKITDSISKLGVKGLVSHNNLVIPGYVAVMSGELEDKSGWKVIVGPKEAAGIPSFLKNI
ncbi:MAG: acetyl-CoA decarbonylase/synthase complex subunit gamma [Candidatus Omnitrophota bacterium]|jgi:acetyl-CoA decarbonylase/synthase complex subunit gamma|nr:MAG: acetyl-CoA decarbonylase/synthase complex subunit gamma [Candidatus Omnitrophota bacterium]